MTPSWQNVCGIVMGSLLWTERSRVTTELNLKGGFLIFFMSDIQHCFICRPSESTVSEDAGIEPRTVMTTALAVRRSNYYRLDLIHKLG
jgi:hypothetical protein